MHIAQLFFPRHRTGRQRQDIRTLFYAFVFAFALSVLVALLIYRLD